MCLASTRKYMGSTFTSLSLHNADLLQGFVNSFGAFQTYYETIISETPSNISWIGSIQTFLLFALGMFSGRALDAGYFRPTVILGISIQILGIFTMSVSKTYWQLLLTHGVCTGLGGGIFFVPVLGVCSTYFAKRTGTAMGIVTSGNAAGGIIYPIVVRQLLDKVGYGWAVRVLAFINIASLAVVIAFMKPRLPPRKSGPLLDVDSLKDVPYVLHVVGMCFLMPAVYFVFYYVCYHRDTSSLIAHTDCSDRLLCAGRACHALHHLSQPGRHTQRRRRSRAPLAWHHLRPLPRRHEHCHFVRHGQMHCPLLLACGHLDPVILRLHSLLWCILCSISEPVSYHHCGLVE